MSREEIPLASLPYDLNRADVLQLIFGPIRPSAETSIWAPNCTWNEGRQRLYAEVIHRVNVSVCADNDHHDLCVNASIFGYSRTRAHARTHMHAQGVFVHMECERVHTQFVFLLMEMRIYMHIYLYYTYILHSFRRKLCAPFEACKVLHAYDTRLTIHNNCMENCA